mgnify:CR=1 FL=1
MSGLQTTGAVVGAKFEFFSSSGSFTVPAGVSSLYVTAVAGGYYVADSYVRTGRVIVKKKLAVSPGDVLAVTIGLAGVSGAPSGGDSSVGSLSTSSADNVNSGAGPNPLAPYGMSHGGLVQKGAVLIEW